MSAQVRSRQARRVHRPQSSRIARRITCRRQDPSGFEAPRGSESKRSAGARRILPEKGPGDRRRQSPAAAQRRDSAGSGRSPGARAHSRHRVAPQRVCCRGPLNQARGCSIQRHASISRDRDAPGQRVTRHGLDRAERYRSQRRGRLDSGRPHDPGRQPRWCGSGRGATPSRSAIQALPASREPAVTTRWSMTLLRPTALTAFLLRQVLSDQTAHPAPHLHQAIHRVGRGADLPDARGRKSPLRARSTRTS